MILDFFSSSGGWLCSWWLGFIFMVVVGLFFLAGFLHGGEREREVETEIEIGEWRDIFWVIYLSM